MGKRRGGAGGVDARCRRVRGPAGRRSSVPNDVGNGIGSADSGRPSSRSVTASSSSPDESSTRCTTSCTCWRARSTTRSATWPRSARNRRSRSCVRSSTGCSMRRNRSASARSPHPAVDPEYRHDGIGRRRGRSEWPGAHHPGVDRAVTDRFLDDVRIVGRAMCGGRPEPLIEACELRLRWMSRAARRAG
jgi:hypothetical protein